jgi:hypothetical protein
MKKLIAIFLLILLTFSAMACKPAKKDDKIPGINPNAGQTEKPPAEPAEDPTTE